MAKYNLIRNGSLEALTVSGTGNKNLTWSQLETLIDGNTTSSGITLIGSDVLYLESDLSNRIKIDGIRLYASDLTKINAINFYYKNSAGENYTACSKNVSTYYYATIPSPSAPQYIMVTISGVNIELYEFQIFNDDYIVAFGGDGLQYAKYLEDAAVGETSTPETVAIYNNSTDPMSADAYVCIDYTGNNVDNYLRISSSINGTYYGIEDGAILEDNKDDSIYKWDMGSHSNTTASGDNVVLIDPTISGGVYTSPIFGLDNKYMASYFITDETTESGTTSISYNENVYNGTIRVRSSNTEPITIDEVYWNYCKTGSNDPIIQKGIVYNGDVIDEWAREPVVGSYPPLGTAVNKRNKNVMMCVKYGAAAHLFLYDKDGNLLDSTGSSATYIFNVNMEFDKFSDIWGYGNIAVTKYLMHYDNDLTTILYNKNDLTDFLYDLAVEMDGDGVWYTDQIDNYIIHRSTDGTLLHQIALNKPRAICGTLDNGCWVIDNTDEKAYRYNSSGALIKTITLNRTATYMTTDMVDGFWYINDNYIYHVTSGGTENVSVNLSQPSKIKGGYNGCIVWSDANSWVKYIDNNGNVTRTFTVAGMVESGYPALFSFKHADFVAFQDTTNIIPVDYDPVWNGSLEWKEIRKDGYFLPKTKYHQIEITLRNNDGVSTPTLEKLIVPATIKIQDIQPQTSKNMYVKTVIPDGISIQNYETRLKAWWGRNA